LSISWTRRTTRPARNPSTSARSSRQLKNSFRP
jgi:hypothetical protein